MAAGRRRQHGDRARRCAGHAAANGDAVRGHRQRRHALSAHASCRKSDRTTSRRKKSGSRKCWASCRFRRRICRPFNRACTVSSPARVARPGLCSEVFRTAPRARRARPKRAGRVKLRTRGLRCTRPMKIRRSSCWCFWKTAGKDHTTPRRLARQVLETYYDLPLTPPPAAPPAGPIDRMSRLTIFNDQLHNDRFRLPKFRERFGSLPYQANPPCNSPPIA